MIYSMTGFGRAALDNDQMSVQVEIRSLNSKYADITLRLGSFLAEKEMEVKTLIESTLQRGKISVHINFAPKSADLHKLTVNKPVVEHYYRELSSLAKNLLANADNLLSIVMTMPDAYIRESGNEAFEEIWPQVQPVLQQAIDACQEFRRQEGKVLEDTLMGYIGIISGLLKKVDERDPARTIRIRERLQAKMGELSNSETFDPNRFEQEMIYFMEKLDISEEKIRLANHLAYFGESIRSEDSNGRKLGFIAQEIGREINTIGSKANDAEIQRHVVEMKNELEKIKEQLANAL